MGPGVYEQARIRGRCRGDGRLGSRGRLLTIYDLDIEAKWTGATKDGDDVSGTVHIPEFSHEVLDGLSEYNVSARVEGWRGL